MSASTRTNTAKWNGTRWAIKVQKDGVRRSFYSGTPGRTGQREANAKADAWLEEDVVPTNATIRDAYELWLESLKLRTSQSNWRPVEGRWNKHVLPYIGNLRLKKVTDQKLQDVIDRAFAAGLSKKTLILLRGDIRALFKYCRRAKLTTCWPEDLTVPAGARTKPKKILQPADLNKLFQCTQTTFYRKTVEDELVNAYRLQVVLGLRPGELIGLEWDDVANDFLYIQRSINHYGEETRGKNDNAVRSIRLFPLARAILESQYDLTGGERRIFHIDSERAYYGAFQRYCKHNGIAQCSMYELRHTFVSIVKTLPAGEVKQIVGHSKDMDTFGIYGHVLEGDSERTANHIENTFQKLLSFDTEK